MFKNIKINKFLSYKKLLLTLLFTFFLIPKNAFAYTIRYNSTFGKFSNGTTLNVVEYDNNHNVISGTYEVPVYDTGIDSSNFIAWYSEYDAKNRVNINEVSENMTVYAAYEKIVWRWNYTGGEQVFSLPIKVGLQLKVWGAQGGTIPGPLSINEGRETLDELSGGYGGYSTGLFDFDANQNIYVNVGGQGSLNRGRNTISDGGYNGGGTGGVGNASHLTNSRSTGGGGATHIATKSGILSTLEDSKDSIAIVAGGGGGKYYFRQDVWYSGPNLGHGGGYIGGYAYRWGTKANGNTWIENVVMGGTQTTAGNRGSFGQGGNIPASGDYGEQGGGGGGYYGGGSNMYSSAGGSGYIGNDVETTRHMAIYVDSDVPTRSAFASLVSDEDQIKTIITNNVSNNATEDYAKLGNGYAIAELTRLTITYVNNVEEDTNTIKDQYVGSLAQNLPITPKTGYTAAWYKDDQVWDFDDPVNFDMTLEAKYTPITYNITYNLDDGIVSGNPDTYTIESDDITLNNPTKENYIFEGWTGTDLTEKTMTVTIPKGSIGDREYTAHFKKAEFTINYDLDGGELEQGVTNPSVYYIDSDDIILNNPSKAGYTFIGWTGSNGTVPSNVVIRSGSTGNKTYKANYRINQYTATFDSNLGTNAVPQTITKNYNEALGTLPTTTKRGSNFEGWFTERNGGTKISSTTKMPSHEVRYYAHWTPITYTIKFNSNGGNGTMNDETFTYDVSKSLTENTFTKDGYIFAGWNTKANGTGTNYIDKQNILNLTDVDGEEIILYAKWTKDEYTISYNADGGQLENPKTTYSVEDEDFTLVKPTKVGYTFVGWTGTAVTNPTKDVVVPTGSTGNRSYTAHWTPTEYTITYDSNLSSAIVSGIGNPTSYTIEDNNITLNNPSEPDTYHFFVGWTTNLDTEEDLSTSFVINTSELKNITVYAVYQTSPYTVYFDSDGGNDIDPIHREGTEDVGTLPLPEKEGYTFLGWYVNDKLIDRTFHSRVDVTAIAKWENPFVYKIIEGEDQTYVLNSNKEIIIKCNGDLSKLTNILIDGEALSSDNYELESGSTILILKPSYLNSLSIGTHKVTFEYSDGSADTNLFVVEEASTNPKTGDNIIKYVMMLIISMVGLGYTTIKFKLKTKKVQ